MAPPLSAWRGQCCSVLPSPPQPVFTRRRRASLLTFVIYVSRSPLLSSQTESIFPGLFHALKHWKRAPCCFWDGFILRKGLTFFCALGRRSAVGIPIGR